MLVGIGWFPLELHTPAGPIGDCCTPIADRLLLEAMLLLLLHGATAMESFTTDAGMRIWVEYPDMSGASEGVPLVVFLHGTTVDPSPTQGLTHGTQGVVDAGFAFAVLEWPHWDGADQVGYPASTFTGNFTVPYYCDTVADKAVQLFGHAETTSLSVLCALENIDCSKGVGVAGYSQGAAIGSRAAMNDDRVTAFLGVGLNTIFLYTDDGAAEATCFRDATLPPSARRYLNGGDDVNWAAGNIAQFPAVIGGPFGMEPQENLDVGKYSLKAMSGYDCGDQLDCLQSDGSGYFIVPGTSHEAIYPFSGSSSGSYGPMMNGFEWLMGRAVTDTPGCPCPEGSRRKLLFGSMPQSTCCAF